MIYHLAIDREFRTQIQDFVYRPKGLADVGFVHCAFEASVVPVANDYFADVAEPVLVLEIDPGKLTSETRCEAAAPIEGGGTAHLTSAKQFPHIYGPVNCDAITGVGVIVKRPDTYVWPDELIPMTVFLRDKP